VRILYRTQQFWNALRSVPDPDQLADAQRFLSPAQMTIFRQMQANEQAHSLRLFRRLREQGETHIDLLAAALLHDIGKSRFPLRLWERVVIVLAESLFPEQVEIWGKSAPRGWRRPFVIARQHPAWGAEMAAKAGASPLVVSLIQRHQAPIPPQPKTLEDQLLHRLQLADNES